MNKWTIADLKKTSNKTLILHCIGERRSRCTNYYSPLYERLQELERWVNKNIPDDFSVEKKERYGFYGINGLYYIYDHKNNNIPSGMGEGTTKKKILEQIKKMNREI